MDEVELFIRHWRFNAESKWKKITGRSLRFYLDKRCLLEFKWKVLKHEGPHSPVNWARVISTQADLLTQRPPPSVQVLTSVKHAKPAYSIWSTWDGNWTKERNCVILEKRTHFDVYWVTGLIQVVLGLNRKLWFVTSRTMSECNIPKLPLTHNLAMGQCRNIEKTGIFFPSAVSLIWWSFILPFSIFTNGNSRNM